MAAEESWLYHVRSQDYSSESVQLPREGATVLTGRSVIVLGRDQGERKAETAVKQENKPAALQMEQYNASVCRLYPYSQSWRAGVERRRTPYDEGSEIYNNYREMCSGYGYGGSAAMEWVTQDADHQMPSKANLMDIKEDSLYNIRSQKYSFQLPGEGADVLTGRSVIVLRRDQGEGQDETARKQESKPATLQVEQYNVSAPRLYPYSQSWRAGMEKRGTPYSSALHVCSKNQDYGEPSDNDQESEIYNNYREVYCGYGYSGSVAMELQEDPIQEMQPVKLPVSKGIGNPWGRLSYADLITAAIMSTEEKRMTLEEIYQWLVSNIPYFGDKGDDKSKVNWKNSIRCNLSTRKRFLRIPRVSLNGVKSFRGWWTVNETMISAKLRQKLLMFQQESHSPQAARSLDLAINKSPQSTKRERQTALERIPCVKLITAS